MLERATALIVTCSNWFGGETKFQLSLLYSLEQEKLEKVLMSGTSRSHHLASRLSSDANIEKLKPVRATRFVTLISELPSYIL